MLYINWGLDLSVLLCKSPYYNQSWDFCAFIIMCLYCTGAPPRVSSHFHQEFPSLQAAGEVEKGDGQEEEPYGPGPSLRPQSMATLMHINIIQCSLLMFCVPGVQEPKLNQNTSFPFVLVDVGSWREGGGRNLITAPSPPEMDNRVPEEGSTSLGTTTPPVEADEPGRNVTADSQREKKDGRESFPPLGLLSLNLMGGSNLLLGCQLTLILLSGA